MTGTTSLCVPVRLSRLRFHRFNPLHGMQLIRNPCDSMSKWHPRPPAAPTSADRKRSAAYAAGKELSGTANACSVRRTTFSAEYLSAQNICSNSMSESESLHTACTRARALVLGYDTLWSRRWTTVVYSGFREVICLKCKHQVAATVVGLQNAWHCQTEEQLAVLGPDHGKERKARLTRWCRQVVGCSRRSYKDFQCRTGELTGCIGLCCRKSACCSCPESMRSESMSV